MLGNDIDPDKDASITVVTQPANGTVTISGTGTGVTYEPNLNYCNAPPGTTPDTFSYTITGGSQADVAVTVTCVDDLPMAINDAATVAEDATATAVNVLANDTDVEGEPDHDHLRDPAGQRHCRRHRRRHGPHVPTERQLLQQPDRRVTGHVHLHVNGGDDATVAVTVTCVNDVPVANNDAATVLEDATATAVNVLANDTDVEGDPITITSVIQPANGTVLITGAGTGLTYQPNLNYCNSQTGGSPDTFTYTVNGGDTATVAMTVTCVGDAPVANNDSATVAEDAAATGIPVLANDTDADGDPITIDTATQPANGTVVLTGGSPGARTGLTYQPNLNYCNSQTGGSPDTFTYTIIGGDDATVAVTVTCVNDTPVAVNDTATVAEDAAATAVNVLANDTDVEGDPITITSATQPANGTVVLTGGSPGARTGLTYQPNANYCNSQTGGSPDTFTYTVNGGDDATVAVTVTCVDDPPVAVNDTATVTEDAAATAIPVLVNDTDIDGGPKTITRSPSRPTAPS